MYKLYLPQAFRSHWQGYWSSQTIKENLAECETDGLNPIFERYLSKSGRILEAGCGIGKWVITLRKRGYDIIGIDNFKPAIKTAKKFDDKLPVMVGDVSKLSFDDNSFDAYVSLGVIEHFEKGPEDVLKEAYRVLKPGGVAIIETPYDNPVRVFRRKWRQAKFFLKTPARIIAEKLGIRAKRKINKQFFFEYHFTKEELKKFVEQAGFKIIQIMPKDDLAPNRHIGLWLDFEKFRQTGGERFELNEKGQLARKVLRAASPWLTACCVVCVAQK